MALLGNTQSPVPPLNPRSPTTTTMMKLMTVAAAVALLLALATPTGANFAKDV